MKKRNKSPPVVHGSLNLYYRKQLLLVVFLIQFLPKAKIRPGTSPQTGSFRPAQAMAGDAIASKV